MRPALKKIWIQNSACITILFALFFLLFNFFPDLATAQMSSGNYKIPTDSINVGGLQSGSASYNELDTIGEVGSGLSSSASYNLSAGFLAGQSAYLSLSAGPDITMSPSISGLSGGSGDGSTSWLVTTDNPAGYTLAIHASTNPAMQSAGSSFANYTTAGSDPDFTWTVASTDSEYGFTPEGADISARYKDNGSICNTGSSDTTDRCWDSITTSDKTIAQRTSANHPSGTTTTVKVKAESGASHIQPNGNYSATIEVTVLAL